MSVSNNRRVGLAILGMVLLVGCAKYRQPSIGDVDAVIDNLSQLPNTQEADIEDARIRAEQDEVRITHQRDSLMAEGLATCSGQVCLALERGELAIGMTRAQVYAATGSLPSVWRGGSGGTAILIPRTRRVGDQVGEVAMVVLRSSMVASFTYREPTGLRTIRAQADRGAAARVRTTADQLLREADDLVAAQLFEQALQKYVAADVLDPDNPEILSRMFRVIEMLIPDP